MTAFQPFRNLSVISSPATVNHIPLPGALPKQSLTGAKAAAKFNFAVPVDQQPDIIQPTVDALLGFEAESGF